MARGEDVTRHAIGVGARRGADAQALAAFVADVAERAGVAPARCGLYTAAHKADDAELREAARLLETTIVFLPTAALRERAGETLTHSPRVMAMLGLGSVAEAAALAGAGPGSVLLEPRAAQGRYTCAIARAAIEDEA